MTLHLWQHWFWITSLKVFMTMTVIVKAQDENPPEFFVVNSSHSTISTARAKLNSVPTSMNVTKLYPVPEKVPENEANIEKFLVSITPNIAIPNQTDKPSSNEIHTNLEPIPNFEFERASYSPSSRFLNLSNGSIMSETHFMAKPSFVETFDNSKDTQAIQSQSERLEREIRKNLTENIGVDIKIHPSYEFNSDGLEHDKLTHHTQNYVRKISSTMEPIPLPTDNIESDYMVYVTPQTNKIPTMSLDLSEIRAAEIASNPEVVKKSENNSKVKDKSDIKSKYSSRVKQSEKDNKSTAKLSVPKLEIETASESSVPGNETTLNLATKSVLYVTAIPSSSMSPTAQINETFSNVMLRKSSNTSSISGSRPMNNSPESQENIAEPSYENTSIIPDYEEINQTSHNKSNDLRAFAHGRMMKSPHAEDLDSWSSGRTFDVAMISGISFGVVVIVTLFGAVSFVLYRRYRWNKPQTLSDKCSNPDSSGYIDDSTLRENSEEMYSLDNDSFLNSLEAMTIQNYWTDHVKHTKL